MPRTVDHGATLPALSRQRVKETVPEGLNPRDPKNDGMPSLEDALIVLLVIAAALAFNLIVAVGVGIAVSLIVFVMHMQRSLIRREGRGPALHARSVWNERRQAVPQQCGHRIAVLELEGAVFFGSADLLEDRIRELVREGVTHVVLDMKRITDIDSTGGLALRRICQRLRKAGATWRSAMSRCGSRPLTARVSYGRLSSARAP